MSNNFFKNKNALQSKAELPLANRMSNINNLTLELPWPWDDLDLVCDHDLVYDLDPKTCKTKLNWCPNSHISIFQYMIWTLT